MKKVSIQEGAIILIPVREGMWVVGKTLYVSKIFRNVILLGLTNRVCRSPEMPSPIPREYVALVYTSQVAVTNGRWTFVGESELTPNEHALSERIVGGEVWLKDKELRSASEEDRLTLPKMQVMGAGLVEDQAGAIALAGQ